QEEHLLADQLLAQLAGSDPASPTFDKVLSELVEAVTHHVEEEEAKVLPGMRERLSDQRRIELGEAFLASRAQHLGEQPGEATKEELVQQARNVGVSGAAGMSKDDLEQELKKQAEE
ncbi:MAG: hemerythrin domain-containing protein, partial [Kribbellaceae bacterium]